MKIFLSGGCKNGKSYLAQLLAKHLAGDDPLFYIATMIPHDEEDRARIRRHLRERDGWGFETVEVGRDIASCTAHCAKGCSLLDSVTALLANEMFPNGETDEDAPRRTAEGLLRFLDGVENAVLVSDWIYGEAARYDAMTEHYRAGLAYLDRTLAAHCDAVAEVCAGTAVWHKGASPL